MTEHKGRGRPRKRPVIRIHVTDTGVRRRKIGGDGSGKPSSKPKCDKAQQSLLSADIDAVITRLEAAEARKAAAQKDRKARREPAHLRTSTERLHHEWDGKASRVTTRDGATIKGRLRRLKCEHGDHAELFVRDWEMVGAALRSMGFDGSGGRGDHQAFPAARIDAAGRLRDVRAMIGAEAYDLCEAYLCLGFTVDKIHQAGGEQHVVLSAQIRAAVDSLARFYTPDRIRQSRTHRAVVALISSIISDAERTA